MAKARKKPSKKKATKRRSKAKRKATKRRVNNPSQMSIDEAMEAADIPSLAKSLHDRDKLLSRYTEGMRGFEWMNFSGLELRGEDLSGADFEGSALIASDFTSANLEGAKMYRAKLDYAIFQMANLNAADLTEVSVHGTSFFLADLKAANLENAKGSGAVFSQANMRRAHLENALLTKCLFDEADLSGAKLNGAHLSESDFSKAKLGSADFQDVLADGAHFNELDIRGTVFDGATLHYSDFTKMKAQRVSFLKVQGKGINLSDGSFIFVSFAEAKLRAATLSGSKFFECNFQKTSLFQSVALGCDFKGSNFKRALGDEANFADSNFEGVDFSSANCTSANFSGCNLDGVDFTNTDLSQANLNNAYLGLTDLSGAVLDRVDFKYVDLSLAKNVYPKYMERWREEFEGTPLERSIDDEGFMVTPEQRDAAIQETLESTVATPASAFLPAELMGPAAETEEGLGTFFSPRTKRKLGVHNPKKKKGKRVTKKVVRDALAKSSVPWEWVQQKPGRIVASKGKRTVELRKWFKGPLDKGWVVSVFEDGHVGDEYWRSDSVLEAIETGEKLFKMPAKKKPTKRRRKNPDLSDLKVEAILEAYAKGMRRFKGVDLRDADLRDANLHKVTFAGGNLKNADLRGANLEGAMMVETVLDGANFKKANMMDANLAQTVGENAIFIDARLTDAKMWEATFLKGDFRGANMLRADLMEGRFQKADFSRANLEDADLTAADLTGAKLDLANLNGAEMGGVILDGVDFKHVDLRGALNVPPMYLKAWSSESGAKLEEVDSILAVLGVDTSRRPPVERPEPDEPEEEYETGEDVLSARQAELLGTVFEKEIPESHIGGDVAHFTGEEVEVDEDSPEWAKRGMTFEEWMRTSNPKKRKAKKATRKTPESKRILDRSLRLWNAYDDHQTKKNFLAFIAYVDGPMAASKSLKVKTARTKAKRAIGKEWKLKGWVVPVAKPRAKTRAKRNGAKKASARKPAKPKKRRRNPSGRLNELAVSWRELVDEVDLDSVSEWGRESLVESEAAHEFSAQSGLQLVGSGIHRMVFALDADRVVKLAYGEDGAAANLYECNIWKYWSKEDPDEAYRLLAPVLDCADDGSWLIMERAEEIVYRGRPDTDIGSEADVDLTRMRVADISGMDNWGRLADGRVVLLDYGDDSPRIRGSGAPPRWPSPPPWERNPKKR